MYYSKVMKQSNYAKIFKALSNEQRLKIFMMIYKQCCPSETVKGASEFKILEEDTCCPVRKGIEKTFTKMCKSICLSRSTISHHIKELQNAGLITCEREGQAFRCMVNQDAIDAIKAFLA
jgi:ArsR family transcriptional regulator, arsenate/arsenite/antimonite-responsive transcriptional repressor